MKRSLRTIGDRVVTGGVLAVAMLGVGATTGCDGSSSSDTSTTTTSSTTASASVASSSSSTSSTGGSSSSSTASSASAGGAGGTGTGGTGGTGTGGTGTGGAGGTGGTGTGGSGGGVTGCTTTATGPTRGSAIALSPDDATLVVANRESGTVTVFNVDYSGALPSLSVKAEVTVGAEPWQVAIDACGDTAYAVLRGDQKVVEITGLKSATPVKGKELAVGSEPTALALSPNNTTLYAASWVDGTVAAIDVATFAVKSTIDLNGPLAGTGLLGSTVAANKSRPALAHPRSIAITNNLDAKDDDEKLVVTEFFAQRTAPEAVDGANADVDWTGLVYRIKASDGSVAVIPLGAIADTGFNDSKGLATGCFPNQLQSITIDGGFAYVPSICASPRGPVGTFQAGACTSDAQCGNVAGACFGGSCKGTCTVDADCGNGGVCDVANGGACKVSTVNFKTLTHPAVSVIDVANETEVTSARANLNQQWNTLFTQLGTADANKRFPLVANELAFAGGVAFASANGADALFPLTYDAQTSALKSVGGAAAPFVDLSPSGIDMAKRGQNPIGVVAAKNKAFAFVTNDVTRNVTVIDLTTQAIAGGVAAPVVLDSTAQPADVAGQSRLRGKRVFNTGLGRWSFKGQAWGACQECHFEGLTDNVSWYFARGPRQSTSLDGSFSSSDPADQRVFNWGAVNDEIADFENVTRGTLGGVGALVTVDNDPPTNADRINLTDKVALPPNGASGLNGSAEAVAATSARKDWDDMKAYIQSLRSPRAPSNLDAVLVMKGDKLFNDAATGGQCQGCHGGSKWTVSTRFYTPSGAEDAALLTTTWDGAALIAAGFPASVLPATAGNEFMRAPNPVSGTLDQLQCEVRNVGTFGVSPLEVSVTELRQDMKAVAQGNETNGKGYNVPSLLNVQTGAPFFHAGNARTLEEVFSAPFGAHSSALASAGFLSNAGDVDALVAYLLSIDETKQSVSLPLNPGSQGGSFCAP